MPPELWVTILIGSGLTAGWGLAAFFMRLVYTGKLVPAHDRDEWRSESRIKDTQIAVKDEQIAVKDQQIGHLAEVGRTVDAIMRAIQPRANREETHETP